MLKQAPTRSVAGLCDDSPHPTAESGVPRRAGARVLGSLRRAASLHAEAEYGNACDISAGRRRSGCARSRALAFTTSPASAP
jgi:hypothetical protein